MKNWSLNKVLIFYGFVGALTWACLVLLFVWSVQP